MRARLTLIVVAVVVLVGAGFRFSDQRASVPQTAQESSGLAGRPAPAPALPAIVNAAVTTSTTAQVLPHSGWRRHGRPAEDILAVVALVPVVSRDVARPRSFPLLI